MATERKWLSFSFKHEEWEASADEFAEIIASVIKNRNQVYDYSEPIPEGDDTERRKLTETRFRIDPKYLGYTGTALPVDKDARQTVCDLIAEKLKLHLNEEYVCVKYDYSMPRVITHFLIYV